MTRPARTAFKTALALTAAFALPLAACAAPKPAARSTPAALLPRADAPPLIVAISIDQLSADLFAEYRENYTGGFARLLDGVVFPSGYQGHAATETCPGHSTLLTGVHPARNGIIANSWMAMGPEGKLVSVYCAEDTANKPASGRGYTASAVHLLASTIGDRLKALWPASRNVAVSGKDRGALMMAGQNADAVYWRDGNGFATLAGRTKEAYAQAASEAAGALVAQGADAYSVPGWCAARDRAIPAGTMTVGTNRFGMAPGDGNGFLRSPRIDEATVALAKKLVDGHNLGADKVPDVLSVSLSGLDYVGHSYGTNGVESCITMAALDGMLGDFFAFLDARGTDYLVVLSADHGGLDLPERASQQGQPGAHRMSEEWAPAKLGASLASELGIAGPVFAEGSASGDVWFAPSLSTDDRARALTALRGRAGPSDDLAAVFSAEELAAAPIPSGNSREWSVLDRVRASYMAGRSGDLIVVLHPQVTPIPRPGPGYVATHGSPWDYDRRVPIAFWRKGIVQYEQTQPVGTVDIAPTLAAAIGLPVKAGEMDGRCLDLDGGEANTCTR